jgi:hypothetical protein
LRHGNSVGVGKAARLQFSLFVRLWRFWKMLPGLSSIVQFGLCFWRMRGKTAASVARPLAFRRRRARGDLTSIRY